MHSWTPEYKALTQDCGLVPLVSWTSIQVQGEDRVSFVHNMCTNDIRRLDAGSCCEAFCTDVKGKVLAHVWVFVESDSINLLAVPGQADSILTHLDRYIIREDVQLQDRSAAHSWMVASGPKSRELLTSGLASDNGTPAPAGKFVTTPNEPVPCLIATVPWLWPECYLLRSARPVPTTLSQSTAMLPPDSSAWNSVRIESAFPLFGTDFDSANLPQEVDRNDQAISFNKGCYLGQETVARLDALGHVNKKLRLVAFDAKEVPPVGTKLISAGQTVGRTTSMAWSPSFSQPIGIAMICRGANDPGQELESAFGLARVITPVAEDR